MTTSKRKGRWFYLVIIAIFAGAYVTNPSEQMHRVAAKERLLKIADGMLAKYGIEQGLIKKLGIDLSGKFVDEMIKTYVSSQNYYLFSTTQVNWDGKSQIIGVGAFNKIFISNKVDEILERNIENYVKEKMGDINLPEIDLKNFNLQLGL